MKSSHAFFVATAVALLAATLPAPCQAPKAQESKDQEAGVFLGKVVPLGEWFKKQGISLDKDAGEQSFGLEMDDGRILPLVKNKESRLFFKDPRLLNRPMRLTGRLVPGVSMLQITKVQSVINGQIHAVYYWCDHCELAATEPGPCSCCGSPVKLYEDPVK
jgi:hypothetical protein